MKIITYKATKGPNYCTYIQGTQNTMFIQTRKTKWDYTKITKHESPWMTNTITKIIIRCSDALHSGRLRIYHSPRHL